MLHIGLDLSRRRLDYHALDAHGQTIADAVRAKGLAPLSCKTDRTDARVLAELCWRDLVPAIWLPDPSVRQERERARFRLHLVRHRTSLKNRVHAILVTHGVPCPVSDLFGARGRALLERLPLPEPWRGSVEASLRLLAYTIAGEIGTIERFATPTKLTGYTGLCPRVYQSGESDRRGSLSKHGPRYLRWALIEATTHACRHPAYATRYQRTARRLGEQRGPKVARVQLARTLAHATWHMLTHNRPFAPASATHPLAA